MTMYFDIRLMLGTKLSSNWNHTGNVNGKDNLTDSNENISVPEE